MTKRDEALMFRVRPEIAAGGYARDDGIVEFYLRVQSLLKPSFFVLDLGAGRGAAAEFVGEGIRFEMLRIRGKVARFIGADVDPVVTQNPLIDEARIIDPDGPLPFEASTFDLVLCDWVLEHIPDGKEFAQEIGRILKPGGWLCARTPNKWSYFALGSRLTPASVEGRVLSAVQPGRKDVDVFPKFYRLNTRTALDAAFKPEAWNLIAYADNPPPAYHGNRLWLFRLLSWYQALIPSILLVFSQKR